MAQLLLDGGRIRPELRIFGAVGQKREAKLKRNEEFEQLPGL